MFIPRRAPLAHEYVIARCPTLVDAHGLLQRLCNGLVEGGSDLQLTDALPVLEGELSRRRPVLVEAAAQPNVTASSIVTEVLKGRLQRRGGGSAGPSGNGDEDVPREEAEASADGVDQAMLRQPYRAVAAAIRRLDASTAKGRRDVIAVGFSGDCVLSVRALCQSSATLTVKSEALAIMQDMCEYLAHYFTWMLTADASGIIPSGSLKEYSFVGALQESGEPPAAGLQFLKQLLRFELANMR